MTAAAPKPRKQEQERADDEVSEVAPGVLRAQLPIHLTGLGHVNCYVLEDERGAAIVDPGMPGPANLRVLRSRLRSIGIPLRRVHTVVVTHAHPDHFGGAGWVRNETGAEIVTHRRFEVFWDRRDPPDLDVEDVAAALPDVSAEDGPAEARAMRRPWESPPWGGPGLAWPWRRRQLYRLATRFPHLARTPRPDRRLVDDETIMLGGQPWRAVHTPGHTDDHICLLDADGRLLLSGDHVLPTITPHIGGWADVGDPLDAYFRSLDKVAALGAGVDLVLPAHGHPFADLAGRATAIKTHHHQRLDVIHRAFAETGAPMTVPEVSHHLFSARAQGTMADSETFAHLEHLRRDDHFVRRERDGEFVYVPAG